MRMKEFEITLSLILPLMSVYYKLNLKRVNYLTLFIKENM